MHARSRPALRRIESVVVPDERHGRVLVLRDTQGLTDAQAVLPPALVRIVARFTGALTCEQIAREVGAEVGGDVPVDVVVRLASELEEALLLEGPAARAAQARVQREFADAAVRAASHAGAAYHGDADALRRYIDEECLARAGAPELGPSEAGGLVALVAPHIDPWRGALGYGRAYGALAATLPAEADTFVLFGTSHAPMAEPFALCRKAFDTPLGPLEADEEAIDALAAAADGFDPYADQLNHKREHSLEFQVVFLRHLLGTRPARIVPVLAGLCAHQASGDDPGRDRRVMRFVEAVRRLFQARPGRVVVVAGADMAHVGPRFGDPRPYGASLREALARSDRSSLDHAVSLDAAGFWSHVAADLDSRRVCGLAPVWSLLQAVTGSATRGRVLHYEQTVDPGDGSIVSHAAVGFYG
jgi:AmmeMemoRadiSam system protein B